jgi:hypothetical protein
MKVFNPGRFVHHDPRSWNYQATTAPTHEPVMHKHMGMVLNQGRLGSCTGNAMAQAINTYPIHQRGEKLLKEKDAVNIYSAATAIDDGPGQYPPEDTGSNGLSVAKVAQARGLIKSYTHSFSVGQDIGALQLTPLLFGTHWHQSMFTPDKDGYVHPDGNVVGGHEILIIGDDAKGTLTVLNSWGGTWGRAGRFLLTYDDYSRLRAEQGDIVVPVR